MDCFVGISDGLRQFAAVAAGVIVGIAHVLVAAYIALKTRDWIIESRGND